MAEQEKAVEKKVLYSYVVTRNSDGSVDVADNSTNIEGAEELSTDKIYDDIVDVSEKVKLKRIQDAAFVAGYNGVAKFYQDVSQQQAKTSTEEEK
jgi:hypothetical protein